MIRRVRKNCKNNKGFTLVELLVTIAVATIVVGGAVGFMMTGYNQYHSQNSNINLQYEAQLAMNQVEDLILNATNGIAYDEATATLTLYNQVQSEAADGTTTTQNIVTTVVWDSENKQLKLSKYNYGENEYGVTGRINISTDQLMADYVNGFSIDLADIAEKKLVGIAMDFSFDEKTYSTKNNVSLRNNIGIATDSTAFSNERIALEALATDIVVSPSSMTVKRGTTVTGFSTYVVGTNFPLQDVTWEFAPGSNEPTSDSTTVDCTTGEITIGADEKTAYFTLLVSSVTPSSNEDSDSKATKTVTVLNKYATGLTVSGITLTGDKTAQITVKVEGFNFEETDVTPYNGISLSFTDKNGTSIDGGVITVGSWSGTYSSDQQLTYTTTITLNNDEYMDQEITVTASEPGLTPGSGTVNFPSVKIEDARIVLYEDGKEVETNSSGAYVLGRGGTYTVGVEVTYENEKTEVIESNKEKWNYIEWTVSSNFTYEEGKLTVPDKLDSNIVVSQNTALKTSSSVNGLNNLTAAVYIPKVELKIVESGNKDTVFPLLNNKQYDLTFQVTGVSSSLAQSYSVAWSSSDLGSTNDNDKLSSRSASVMTASFKYKLGDWETTSNIMTLKFVLMKDQVQTNATATLKVQFGKSNVYEIKKSENGGPIFQEYEQWIGQSIQYNPISLFLLPANQNLKDFYLLDGTVSTDPTYISITTDKTWNGEMNYFITYNGSMYKWKSENGRSGWYQQ
jgi:prepilin-type N-terminal cleavage/methylation domain-containing protein